MSVNIFDYQYTKISDLLIPIDTFIQEVCYIEHPPECIMNILNHFIRSKCVGGTHSFIMPYPYSTPVYKGNEQLQMLIEKDNRKLEEKILNLWLTALDKRVYPLLENMVTDELVHRFDQSKTDRAIIHVFSGKVIIYNHSNTTLVNIISFSSYLTTLMSLYSRPSDSSPLYNDWRKATVRSLINVHGDQVIQFYDFMKSDKLYHIRGWYDDRTRPVADELAKDVLLKYQRGDKIILTI